MMSIAQKDPGSGFLCHHEWGTLKEAIVGISPKEDFVIPIWYDGLDFMPPKFKKLSCEHGGQRLFDVDPDFATALESEVDQLAAVLAANGVVVHRPTRLHPPESTYLTAKAEGAQIFPRDDMLVVGEQVIEIGMKIQWRRREVFGVRPVIQSIAQSTAANWSAMPLASPPSKIGGEDENPNNCFLAGGDILLNGYNIYVGNSGLASNANGIEWLQHKLGPSYCVQEIKIRREALHLDACMMLVGPKLGIRCPDWIHTELPESLSDFDWIDLSEDEASYLGCNVCVINEGKIVVPDQQFHLADQLREKLNGNLDVVWIDYENVVKLGGGLRCCHHPIIRESKLE